MPPPRLDSVRRMPSMGENDRMSVICPGTLVFSVASTFSVPRFERVSAIR